MAGRLIEARIVEDHASIRLEHRGADEWRATHIAGTDLVLGDDMTAFLDARTDTRDREIWRIDANMHHDDGETFGLCFVGSSLEGCEKTVSVTKSRPRER